MAGDENKSLNGSDNPISANMPTTLKLNFTIQPLKLDGNLNANWKIWKRQYTFFLRANALEDVPDARKSAILIQCLGSSEKIIEIFKSFNMPIETVRYKELLEKFESYFAPKKKKTVARNIFFKRRQSSEESINEFVTDLTNLSFQCEFDTLREGIVKDIFIIGLHSRYL